MRDHRTPDCTALSETGPLEPVYGRAGMTQSVTALRINLTAVETVLARTPILALGEFRCPAKHSQFAGGGPQTCHYIVFPRNPVRIHVHGADSEVACAATLRLYNIGDSYDREMVGRHADESDWIALSPQIVDDLLTGARAVPAANHSRLFSRRSAPLSARLCLLQRRLFSSVKQNPLSATLGIEETVLGCAASAIAEAVGFWGRGKSLRRAPRLHSERRRTHIVEQTKEILALDPAIELSIADLAARVHCSAAHLARVFVAHTGCSLHEFRQRVRLLRAVELLQSGGSSLASIAFQVGYASHSHMTQAFRTSLGTVPSCVRQIFAPSSTELSHSR